MDNTQVSQEKSAHVLSPANRRRFLAALLFLSLFLASGQAHPKPNAAAQAADQKSIGDNVLVMNRLPMAGVKCSECQQALLHCLENGGSACDLQYDACIEGCEKGNAGSYTLS